MKITMISLMLCACSARVDSDWPTLMEGFSNPYSEKDVSVMRGNATFEVASETVQQAPVSQEMAEPFKKRLVPIRADLGAQKVIFLNQLEKLILVVKEGDAIKHRNLWMTAQLELSRLAQVMDPLYQLLEDMKTAGLSKADTVYDQALKDRETFEVFLLEMDETLNDLEPKS